MQGCSIRLGQQTAHSGSTPADDVGVELVHIGLAQDDQDVAVVEVGKLVPGVWKRHLEMLLRPSLVRGQRRKGSGSDIARR